MEGHFSSGRFFVSIVQMIPHHWILLFLICVVPLAVAPVRGAEESPHGRFDSEIDAMLSQDRTNPPPSGAVIFTGSSTIRAWKSLAADMPGLTVVNRGFGGSTMADLNRYAPRIVFPLRPRIIVVYEGDNDIAGGKSPETVLNEMRDFIQSVGRALPETRLVFVSVKPSPSRRGQLATQRQFNKMLMELCRTTPKCTYVDIAARMLNSNGEPNDKLFLEDRLHLNRDGYQLWAGLIKGGLDALR